MSTHTFKTVFFDVDQTIIDTRNGLRPGVKETFSRLKSQGYRIVLWSAAGPRWEVVREHGLQEWVSNCYRKPFPLESANLNRLRGWLRSRGAICVDDDSAVVDSFGGILVQPYWQADPDDTAMQRVAIDLANKFWRPRRSLLSIVDWLYVLPRFATVTGFIATFLVGILRLLLPATILIQPLTPNLAFAATSFAAVSAVVSTYDAPVAAMAGDFDKDGFEDVVAIKQGAAVANSSLDWFENSCTSTPCTPSWTRHRIDGGGIEDLQTITGSTTNATSIALSSWTVQKNELVIVSVFLKNTAVKFEISEFKAISSLSLKSRYLSFFKLPMVEGSSLNLFM